MNESATVKPLIPDAALDRLYRTARSFNDFHGAAGHRRRAARALRSGEMGPDHRQLAAAARGVREKRRGQGAARAGAVVAKSQEGARRAGAGDSGLRHGASSSICRGLFHNPQARSWYETTPEAIRTTALRNATLQGAYLMLAARAIGLDCGPMSGFKNDVVDAAFFPEAVSNRISCAASATAIHRPCRNKTIVSESTKSLPIA